MARQAWNRAMEPDRIVLEHIRALLLALAVLVERAAGLPTVERLRFLAVMTSGEAEARRLIMAMASDLGSPAETAAPRPAADPCPSTPATAAVDSALLAARLRMLALVMDAMLALSGPVPLCRHTVPSIGLPDCNPHRKVAQFTPSPALRATSPPLNGAEEPQCRR